MKITAYLTQDAIQFNLIPESEHERNFMALLKKYTGEVHVEIGANIGMCRGGYLRDFGRGSLDSAEFATAITISRKAE